MNCITQQQPASAGFARLCGWAKVKVGVPDAALFSRPTGNDELGLVPRLSPAGGEVYLERTSSSGARVRVVVRGDIPLDGRSGWIDDADIESAGEKCPSAYSVD